MPSNCNKKYIVPAHFIEACIPQHQSETLVKYSHEYVVTPQNRSIAKLYHELVIIKNESSC